MAPHTAMTDYAVPTGDFIEEWIEDHQTSQTALAARMGVSRKHLNRIIAGAPLTPEIALKLEFATAVPATYWLGLEATYRADVTRLGFEKELDTRTDLLDMFSRSIKTLRNRGIVTTNRRQPGRLLMELMAFFRVGDPAALEHLTSSPRAAFRQTTAHAVDWASVATWLRLGELEFDPNDENLSEYSRTQLESSLASLRQLTIEDDAPQKAVRLLAACGVSLLAVPEVEGCRAYGATRWIDSHPVIQLSLRGKTDGQLWFTLFHEVGHVLLHPRGEVFIDGLDRNCDWETEADSFAQESLIPIRHLNEVRSVKSKSAARQLAARIGVPPGVIAGYLHHERLWPHSVGRDLYRPTRLVSESQDGLAAI